MTTTRTVPPGGVRTDAGLATLGPEATRLVAALDEVFLAWAVQAGAVEKTLPPLLPVAELEALGVYRNFPQLAMVASALRAEEVAEAGALPGEIPATLLEAAQLALPSATCYGVYLDLKGQEIPDGSVVTAVAGCYRNETRFDGLRRLRAFRMREIVALGSPEHTQRHLARFRDVILRFAEQAGLELEATVATDPFYDAEGPQAAWQRLSPVKHEFVHGGDLAVASVNAHRTYFGDRCAISLAGSGARISTSCVAFGLERWVHALGEAHGGDWDRILAAVERSRAVSLR
ncbi:hypothetical protein [Kitasatospora sp. NPDC050543]|uniref:hypothetical protein n=1 Tax=Kitasatospora sp. NPDC050543 TaxID=3364054 RepID=UPI00379CB981